MRASSKRIKLTSIMMFTFSPGYIDSLPLCLGIPDEPGHMYYYALAARRAMVTSD
jgi:hypothetical protein